jgi:surface protein
MNAWGEHLAGTGAALSDMRACFQLCEVFNQDLDEWAEGVKNVTQAGSMFDRAYVFNGDITTWKLAQNTNLSYMFRQAYQFNRDLSNWDVSKVTSFIWCFDNCRAFSQSLANWDFSSATDTTYMFRNCTLMGTRLTDEAGTWTFGSRWEAAARMFDNIPNFNPDLSNWENQVAGLKRMDGMFVNCSQFEGIGLELWKVSSVINMNQMFYNCGLFNKDISNWDVSNVGIPETGAGGFYQTFWKCTNFNQTLANWNVNQCADFRYMFRDCSSLTDLECETWFEYNDDPDLWPSKATTLLEMFRGCSSFDKDLSKWDTRNIYDLRNMFRDCTVFNNGGMPMPWTIQTVSTQLPPRDPPPGWKGSILLDGMFNNTAFFNADISTWNVSGVTGAIAVFERAKGFDQDLSNWRLDSCRNATYFLNGVNKNFNSALDRLFPTTAPDDTREPVLERLYAFCANTNWNNGQANTELPGKELLWDVSKCWDFRYFCWNNQEFNQNIGNWDVSSATQMTHMFGVTGKLATDSSPSEFGFNCGDAPADPKFNPIQNWDVTSVQDIRQIFDRAYAFNKNLNSWNLRDCATFSQAFKDADVWTNGGSDDGSRTIPLDWSGEQMRNATNTVNMFRSLARYDEAVYLNMSLVSEAGGMFYQSSSFAKYFDKFLPDWNISSLQNALEFVNFAIPQATMDNILISWAEKGRRNPPEARTNVEIFFGNSSFTGGGAAEDAFNFLTGAIEDGGLNWTITGLVRRAP